MLSTWGGLEGEARWRKGRWQSDDLFQLKNDILKNAVLSSLSTHPPPGCYISLPLDLSLNFVGYSLVNYSFSQSLSFLMPTAAVPSHGKS